jgi:hypothetical protein
MSAPASTAANTTATTDIEPGTCISLSSLTQSVRLLHAKSCARLLVIANKRKSILDSATAHSDASLALLAAVEADDATPDVDFVEARMDQMSLSYHAQREIDCDAYGALIERCHQQLFVDQASVSSLHAAGMESLRLLNQEIRALTGTSEGDGQEKSLLLRSRFDETRRALEFLEELEIAFNEEIKNARAGYELAKEKEEDSGEKEKEELAKEKEEDSGEKEKEEPAKEKEEPAKEKD